ncbi:TPA: hypothetical protein ACH3X2_012535 [Trebouxia sp. C0005]
MTTYIRHDSPDDTTLHVSLSLSLSLSLSASESKSNSQIATALAIFWALASDCTGNRGLLVAQALLQVIAKLAQQANFVKMLWLTAHCFASQTGYYKRKLACFHR